MKNPASRPLKLKIKTGDQVKVISGSEKGKKGKVLELDRLKLLIKVEGVRVQTHFDRKEGILKKEGFLPYSKVALIQKASKEKVPAKTTGPTKTAATEGA
jgi:large subunit ribosomal protein L24